MVEMEAMYMGFWDTRKLDCHRIVVIGDSLCATRWLSGRCEAPWALANVVEEVKDISKDCDISFVHVKRSANAKVDILAKEGVEHHDLKIDLFVLNVLSTLCLSISCCVCLIISNSFCIEESKCVYYLFH